MSPRVDTSMSSDEIARFLDLARVAVLTSLDAGGWPHSAGMWYVRDTSSLRMWTYAKSQKARNLDRDRRCAALIESGERYEELKGVLIRAHATLVFEHDQVAEIGRALYERYTAPHTGIDYQMGPHVEIERQAHKRVGIILPMEGLASWDHSKLR